MRGAQKPSRENNMVKRINYTPQLNFIGRHTVDPVFSLDAFPLNGRTHFFHLFGENLLFRKTLGFAIYFCLFFLKGKQNKKEKP